MWHCEIEPKVTCNNQGLGWWGVQYYHTEDGIAGPSEVNPPVIEDATYKGSEVRGIYFLCC